MTMNIVVGPIVEDAAVGVSIAAAVAMVVDHARGVDVHRLSAGAHSQEFGVVLAVPPAILQMAAPRILK